MIDPATRRRPARPAGLLLAAAVVFAACTTATAPPAMSPAGAPAGASAAVPGSALPPAVGAAEEVAAGAVEITLLHFNDVYEIGALDGGAVGGLARVATLRRRLLAENPNTFTVLGGDFLSPSAIGTAEVEGERLAGRQMVAVLNALGLDLATYGNHEFDIRRPELEARLSEIAFPMVVGNVTWADGSPLPATRSSSITTVENPGGRPVKIGWIGVVLPDGAPDYVAISDPIASLSAQASELRDRVDILVALTHLAFEDDAKVAAGIAGVDLVLGGHEHENFELWRGGDLTPVLKADANVRTVFIVRLRFDPASGALAVDPQLVPITDALPDDPETAAVVEHWTALAFAGFRQNGFEPEAEVAVTDVALDGRSSEVRNRSNPLTDLIAGAMLGAAPGADAAVYNSGSIRIDDIMQPGPLTQYDVIRILPFGGEVVEADVRGDLLVQVLDQGLVNRGSGGFLQTAGVAADGAGWKVEGEPIDEARTYRVAFTDFLLSGRESGLAYLTPDHPGLQLRTSRGDIRQAVIAELRKRWPPGAGD